MQRDPSIGDGESDPQLEEIRSLILGKENHLVTDCIKKNARHIMTDVLTEALHDRQNRDGSVNKVLLPLVEDSVQQSVAHNSERLVSSLYPLVGSLVRKSVTAFLTDFIESTNQLLENSLSIKGLKWRINAWQAGVSFAQYAASQTFVYRVEHVFLIHRETGLLLSSVDFNNSKSNADLISSMLTAINDFVGDSFLANEDGVKEQLQSVSTDNFNLLIKPGPSALVVAAVIGHPPQKVNNQLQLVLEDIHSIYIDEFNSFDGDNQNFESSKNLLHDCLLSEQKTLQVKKKKPWLAWSLLCAAILFGCYQINIWYKNKQLVEKIMQLDHQPGLIINQLKVSNNKKIILDVLRDPDAIEINDWFKKNKLETAQLKLTERNFSSLDPEILQRRAQQIITKYPNIKSLWQKDTLLLTGELNLTATKALLNKLSIAGFIGDKNLNTEQLQLTSFNALASSSEIKQQIFNEIVQRISAIQLNFDVANEKITPQVKLSLLDIYQKMQQLGQLATELDINFGLLIIGLSDNSGNKAKNNRLSIKRAENAAHILEEMGLNKEKMYVTGLGQIDIKDIKNASRKVIFNVIFIAKEK